MARTSGAEVKQIFETDLTNTEVEYFLTAANLLVDQYVSISASFAALGSSLLTEIERYLCAHIASSWDQRLTEQSFGDSKVKFQVVLGEGLKSTQYGQMVLILDTSGTLVNVGKRKVIIEYMGDDTV
jgi:hypothetical protein